jgi:Subtilase family
MHPHGHDAGLDRKPDRDAVFLRLLVEVEEAVGSAEGKITAAARRLRDRNALGTDWAVTRLVDAIEDDREGLARFFEVTGHVDAYTLEREAWDLSYDLRDALGAAGVRAFVEPDLPSSVYYPGGERIDGFLLARAELPGTERVDWVLDNTRCREAWELQPPIGGAARGQGILIAHPDTGYTDHPELERSVLDLAKDADVINGDDDARDPLQRGLGLSPGHGTRTGAVIASRAYGALTGIAPLATLVPVRTIKGVVLVFNGDVTKAVDHAYRSGCHVVSMSLGGIGFVGLEAAINRAVREGLIVMAAAGNLVGFVVWPARFRSCIAVAATNIQDVPWRDSCHGSEVDVCAPGESVWVPDLESSIPPRLSRSDGTSYAVACLAGAAALWLAHHGRDALIARYGKPQVQAAFLHVLKTAGFRRPQGWDAGQFGVGILDARALLGADLPDADVLARTDAAALTPAAPTREDPVEDLAAVLPEMSREQVVARLQEVFRTRGTELDATLDRYGKELLYRLVEDAAVRQAFAEGVPSAPTAAAPRHFQHMLSTRVSRSLASAMGMDR